MDPHPIALIPARFERLGPACETRMPELTSDWSSLFLEASIRADIRRLFHALTVPEYLEAWISFPGHHFGCSTIASRNNEDFVIEHSCEGKREISIAGTYSVCRRHNLSFSWRVDGNLRMPKTEIDIRLRGDFENTRVVLQQNGFVSPSDCAWHATLWSASLGRLSALYGSPDLRTTPNLSLRLLESTQPRGRREA
jgi:hypothetical protein